MKNSLIYKERIKKEGKLIQCALQKMPKGAIIMHIVLIWLLKMKSNNIIKPSQETKTDLC